MCVQERWLLQPVGEAVKFPQQKNSSSQNKNKSRCGDGKCAVAINSPLGSIYTQRPNLTPSLQPGRAEGPLLPACGEA